MVLRHHPRNVDIEYMLLIYSDAAAFEAMPASQKAHSTPPSRSGDAVAFDGREELASPAKGGGWPTWRSKGGGAGAARPGDMSEVDHPSALARAGVCGLVSA